MFTVTSHNCRGCHVLWLTLRQLAVGRGTWVHRLWGGRVRIKSCQLTCPRGVSRPWSDHRVQGLSNGSQGCPKGSVGAGDSPKKAAEVGSSRATFTPRFPVLPPTSGTVSGAAWARDLMDWYQVPVLLPSKKKYFKYLDYLSRKVSRVLNALEVHFLKIYLFGNTEDQTQSL